MSKDDEAKITKMVSYHPRYEKVPDLDNAVEVAWKSSPVAYIGTWTSPVLVIHADHDRNVRFNQSTDLVRRLNKKGIELETMVIVDDTHHWMKHANELKLDETTASYFVKKLLKKKLCSESPLISQRHNHHQYKDHIDTQP